MWNIQSVRVIYIVLSSLNVRTLVCSAHVRVLSVIGPDQDPTLYFDWNLLLRWLCQDGIGIGFPCAKCIYILRLVSTPESIKYLGPNYERTLNIHSRRLGFMRCDERLSHLRIRPLRNASWTVPGIQYTSNNGHLDLPLVTVFQSSKGFWVFFLDCRCPGSLFVWLIQ